MLLWSNMSLFSCSICSSFSHRKLFRLAPVSIWYTLIIMSFCFCFCTSLLGGTMRHCRLLLCISCPSPRISHFSKEPWFTSLWNDNRNQDLGMDVLTADGMPLLADPLSGQSKEINVCILNPDYTHNLQIFWHVTIYIHTELNIHTDVFYHFHAELNWWNSKKIPRKPEMHKSRNSRSKHPRTCIHLPWSVCLSR